MTPNRLACRVFGHSPTFTTDGPTMRWECERGCGQGGGSKGYDTAEEAQRYAAAFNTRDSANLGERAPLIGLLPLRLWRLVKRRRSRQDRRAG
jgi:hypothetical protein